MKSRCMEQQIILDQDQFHNWKASWTTIENNEEKLCINGYVFIASMVLKCHFDLDLTSFHIMDLHLHAKTVSCVNFKGHTSHQPFLPRLMRCSLVCASHVHDLLPEIVKNVEVLEAERSINFAET
jgi:hypothetical protein